MSFFAASSPSPELLPPPLLVNCTFKWKIFGSQQKHCIQKRQSRSYSNTEEIVPGKLPFGRNRRVFFFFFPFLGEVLKSSIAQLSPALVRRAGGSLCSQRSAFKGSALPRGREKLYSAAFVPKLKQSGPLHTTKQKQRGEIKREEGGE